MIGNLSYTCLFKGRCGPTPFHAFRAGSESEAELGHAERQDQTYGEVTVLCQRSVGNLFSFLEEKDDLEPRAHIFCKEGFV